MKNEIRIPSLFLANMLHGFVKQSICLSINIIYTCMDALDAVLEIRNTKQEFVAESTEKFLSCTHFFTYLKFK